MGHKARFSSATTCNTAQANIKQMSSLQWANARQQQQTQLSRESMSWRHNQEAFNLNKNDKIEQLYAPFLPGVALSPYFFFTRHLQNQTHKNKAQIPCFMANIYA